MILRAMVAARYSFLIVVYLKCVPRLLYPSSHYLAQASLFSYPWQFCNKDLDDQPGLNLNRLSTTIDFTSGSQARIGCHNVTQFTYFCEGYGSFQALTWYTIFYNSTSKQIESISYVVNFDTWLTNSTSVVRKTIDRINQYRVSAVLIQDINDRQSCQNPVLASTLTVQIHTSMPFNITCIIDVDNNITISKTYNQSLTIGDSPAKPQYLQLTVLFCYHENKFRNTTVMVEWSPPANEELVPLSFYHITIFEQENKLYNTTIRAEPGQNASFFAVFPTNRLSTYSASVVAESECGVKSENTTVTKAQPIFCSASNNTLNFMSVVLCLLVFVNTAYI